jgi:hypothetical protein
MSIRFGQFEFEGPFRKPEDLQPRPGFYALISTLGGKLTLLGFGHSEDLKRTMEDHKSERPGTGPGTREGISLAANYTKVDEERRRRAVAELRRRFLSAADGDRST